MRPQTIIAKKRDGKALERGEIDAFIKGVTDGTWADYQISALIMAMFLNELNLEEQSLITQSMLHSGRILDFSDIAKPKSDKHSTGGVGDKTSLLIAPLAASCGIAVPMISGRGLGHTGGTLDKLESIKGYNVRLSTEDITRVLGECGFAMAGQTEDIAPADKKIYALRDATATVPTIPLIVASIMSKKLAEGLDSLVLDVKTGNGAFIEEYQEAKRLAEAMVETGNSCGVKTRAFITDMNQPLGQFVGNALEVYECVKILKNEPEELSGPLIELTLDLTSAMLQMSGVSKNAGEARQLLVKKIEDGSALEAFRHNLRLQGGDESICDAPDSLVEDSLTVREVTSESSGFVESINTKAVGFAVCGIGGGRVKADDELDYGVGFGCRAVLGKEIRAGEPLGVIYCRSEDQFESASAAIKSAYVISDNAAPTEKLVKEIIE